MNSIIKKFAFYVGVVMCIALSYIGALTIIAEAWDGDERSFFAALFTVAFVAWLLSMKGGAEK